jgi:Peptidase_C39 like family
MSTDRRTVLKSIAAGAAGALAGAQISGVAEAKPKTDPTRDIAVSRWRSAADFAAGTADGVTAAADGLRVAAPLGVLTYVDPFTGGSRDYEYATWESPWVTHGFLATQAVASWNADTPSGTWVQVELRGLTNAGTTSKWYVMARWAADDAEFSRTSVPGQRDADGTVDIDTFIAATGGGLVRWQLRATLYRAAGTSLTPVLRSVGAMVSQLPPADKYPTSTPGTALGTALPVPQFSQDLHVGQYPQWDNGGEAWCSPTSTSMVLAYWGTGPSADDLAWVDPSYVDPQVDYAARNTYDNNYDGCGNWPFNTAYAGRYGLDAYVTRMRSFNEVELFVAQGIPVIVSAAFKKGQVPGADYTTNGHLMVIVGFTADGDPVMNDPATATDAGVRKIFGRAEFETAWRNSSGGTVYLIHPTTVALPAAPAQANW